MLSDAQLMESCPDFVSVGAMLKALPSVEGGRRILYFEASNEGLDLQGEVVAAKALADSADYYKRFGNVDIDHYTQIGARLAIPDYPLYEIGRPLEVGQRGKSTFVKSEIFSGDGPAAERANMVWSSLTDITPPQRWYPSVGGAVLAKSVEVDPETGLRKSVIARVRWNNIGISKTPVNASVPTCATIPLGTFAKCMTPGGLNLSKAIEATPYTTDSAQLSGGAALRGQSLDHGIKSYWDFRERIANDIRAGRCGQRAPDMAAHAVQQFGLPHDEAAEHVERFVRDLQTALTKRKAQ